ncbi:MAG: hypothetical protein HQ568_10795 [Calditrichaeota bacterium]|nr:hypothetical protein [Calditrichota bacterium]
MNKLIVISTLFFIIFCCIYVWKKEKGFIPLTGFFFALIVIFIFQNKLTELGFGPIFSAKLKQVNSDIEEINNIKNDLIEQSSLIDSLANIACNAAAAADSINRRVTELDVFLNDTYTKTEQLSNVIQEKSANTESEIYRVDSLLLTAKNSLDQIRTLNEFTSTVVAAENGNRKAFDKVCEWCDDKSYPFVQQAVNVWHKIKDEYGNFVYQPLYPITWKEGIIPSELTFERLVYNYRITNPLKKPGIIKFVWERDDFSIKTKMNFLVLVIKEDESLNVLQFAGSYFNREAGLKFSPILWREQLKWWEENKDKYE